MKNAHGRTCKKTKVYIYLYISPYENVSENGCIYIYRLYIYIDLAWAESEALGNIFSLLKLNIKRVKLNGEGNENCEKTTIGLISKKKIGPCSTLPFLLYISLPLFCTTTT